MNAVKCVFLLGLVGLLSGCLTPEEMGYLVSPEPVYTTPVATPVYNTSPAYYATPVSGYSTMTVYDGYHPGYGGPRYPHHNPPPPPHGGRPVAHGVHGGPGGNHGGGTPAVNNGGSRPGAHGREPIRSTKPQSAAQKPLPGKDLSGKGSQWKGTTSGKGGSTGKGGTSGKGASHGKGTVHRRK